MLEDRTPAVFSRHDYDDHEQVVFFHDTPTNLSAIVAIHSTAPFGVAGGGCRMWPYTSEGEALRDVLRLSRAMSYKLALCEMPAGGAKSVVIGDPRKDKNEGMLKALGRFVERLCGKYIIAEDVGTTEADMRVIATETKYVVGQHTDTGPATAYGTFLALRAAVKRALGRGDLEGVVVGVQGLGNVGRRLCGYLRDAGAKLIVTDLDPARVAEATAALGAIDVRPDAIYDQDIHVFAPCALGAVLSKENIARLRCKVVAGSANNQLDDEDEDARRLSERGILYAPDFIVNAGGVIGAAQEGMKLGSEDDGTPIYDEAVAFAQTEKIPLILEAAFARADRDATSPHHAAVAMAKEAIAARRAGVI